MINHYNDLKSINTKIKKKKQNIFFQFYLTLPKKKHFF